MKNVLKGAILDFISLPLGGIKSFIFLYIVNWKSSDFCIIETVFLPQMNDVKHILKLIPFRNLVRMNECIRNIWDELRPGIRIRNQG